MFDLNLGDWQNAISKTGSSYQLPADPAASPAVAQTATPTPNEMPATGSSTKEWAQYANQANEAANTADQAPGLKNSPAVGLIKKAAGLVAAYYTGGASAALMNGASQVAANNGRGAEAGAAQGAMKLFGG